MRAEITKAKKRFAEARTVELLRPGAERIADRCVHEGEPCPGAPWQGLSYERQLTHKREQVDEALRRIGGLDGFELEEIEPALEQWRYRNKLEYSFGERDGEPTLGFHARGRWDLVVDVDDCLLASERGNAARNAVRDWARLESVPAYDPQAREGVLRNLVVREGWRTGQIQTRLVTSAARLPQTAGRPAHGDRGRLRRHRRPDRGARRGAPARGAQRPEAGDVARRLLPDQHRDGRAPLRDRRRVRRPERQRAGLRPLLRDRHDRPDDGEARPARSGAWRSSPRRSPTPSATPSSNKIENAHFFAGSARTGVRPLIEQAGKPDVVVIDPPRAGLSQKIVRRVIECEAKKIVYVSCNPTTLAPNAAQLVEAGYTLRGSSRSTCSPRPPTSSAWRCWRSKRSELERTTISVARRDEARSAITTASPMNPWSSCAAFPPSSPRQLADVGIDLLEAACRLARSACRSARSACPLARSACRFRSKRSSTCLKPRSTLSLSPSSRSSVHSRAIASMMPG